jgi:hypothetical protein
MKTQTVKDKDVVEYDNLMYWSLTQLKNAFGVSRDTITTRLNAANLHADKKRRGFDVYHIADAARAILANDLHFTNGDDPETLPPKDRLDWFRGENEKAKYLKESGQLIPTSEVTKEYAKIVKISIRALENLPDILEMKCSLKSEAVMLVERECDLVREELAQKLEDD